MLSTLVCNYLGKVLRLYSVNQPQLRFGITSSHSRTTYRYGLCVRRETCAALPIARPPHSLLRARRLLDHDGDDDDDAYRNVFSVCVGDRS